MTDIADRIVALNDSVVALADAVGKLNAPVPATVDLSPVVAAINEGTAKILSAVADVRSQLEPTPAAPAATETPVT